MFITLKQLEEEKTKAVREFEERQWARERFDTKVLVSDSGNHWSKRYFATRKGGRYYTWYQGATSWSTDRMEAWDYAKLAEEDAE